MRHGQTDSNVGKKYCGQTDTGLNDTGREQAAAAAQRLYTKLGGKFDTMHSSHLTRAYETARIIAGRFGAEETSIAKAKELAEANFGVMEDMSYEEIMEKHPGEYLAWAADWVNHVIKDGESARMVYDRVGGFFKNFLKTHDCGTHIFVMHMGTIAHAISYLLEFGVEAYWRFSVDNAGAVIIRVNREKFSSLIALNI